MKIKAGQQDLSARHGIELGMIASGKKDQVRGINSFGLRKPTKVEREKELKEQLANGSLLNEDVTYYNAGECELDRDTDYYELGKQVKSWTEINAMFSEHNPVFDSTGDFITADRFLPKLDNVKIISWPWLWFLDSINTHAKENLSVFQEIRDKQLRDRQPVSPSRLFTSMMRRLVAHREMMWDLLNYAGLIASQPFGPDSVCTNVAIEGYQVDLPYNNYIWTNVPFLPPPWYLDCAIDVVCETITDHLFYTEKTWKPLFNMRLPLYLSGKAHYQKLTEMGFRFPDWLQTESIDYLETDYLRSKRIVEILLELKSRDWQTLFNQSWDIRVHNQENCLRMLIDGKVPPPPIDSAEYQLNYENAKETAQKCWDRLSH